MGRGDGETRGPSGTERTRCDDGGQNARAKKQPLALPVRTISDFRLAPGPSQDDAERESPGGKRSWDVERELSGLTGELMNPDILRVPAEFLLIAKWLTAAGGNTLYPTS